MISDRENSINRIKELILYPRELPFLLGIRVGLGSLESFANL